jgi:hypothetical protein
MERLPWHKAALTALAIGIGLFILPHLIVMFGGPVEIVGGLSLLAMLSIAVAFVLLVVASATRASWSIALGAVALAAEIAAGLLLLVREPQPAYLHPEWAWYWPVVNSLYLGGLALAVVAFLGAAVGFAATRARMAGVALLVTAAAIAVNRLAPYR